LLHLREERLRADELFIRELESVRKLDHMRKPP
jgi:hypothetical protein